MTEKWKMSKQKEELTEFFRWLWDNGCVDSDPLFQEMEADVEDSTGRVCSLTKKHPVFGEIVEKYLQGDKIDP